MTNPELLSLFGVFISAATALNGFLFKLVLRRIDALRTKVDDLKRCLHETLESLPITYVMQKEHRRELDKLEEIQCKHSDQLTQQAVTLAKVVSRLGISRNTINHKS